MQDNTKEYVCVCGKVCTNSQSFNGHKSHCKEHRLAKGGEANYESYLEKQAQAALAARNSRKKYAAEARKTASELWLSEKHICEHCGKVMTERFGSGRFCSESCAKTRKHSECTKNKIRNSLIQTFATQHDIILPLKYTCRVCGIKIKSCNKTGFCQHCLRHSPEGLLKLSELGRQTYEASKANGTHKGWQSRNKISYAEKFWTQVLDNNHIKYEREVPVWHGTANYFLDFVIEANGKLVDLEIDGKQHTYSDRKASDMVRDQYLTNNGYIVYRIPWNELNSDQGKVEMQNKIDKFMKFYETL
jgi:very-short-patch-repair endonuclease